MPGLTGVNEKGEPNNHLYQHIKIDKGRLEELPESNILNGVLKIDLSNEIENGD